LNFRDAKERFIFQKDNSKKHFYNDSNVCLQTIENPNQNETSMGFAHKK